MEKYSSLTGKILYSIDYKNNINTKILVETNLLEEPYRLMDRLMVMLYDISSNISTKYNFQNKIHVKDYRIGTDNIKSDIISVFNDSFYILVSNEHSNYIEFYILVKDINNLTSFNILNDLKNNINSEIKILQYV